MKRDELRKFIKTSLSESCILNNVDLTHNSDTNVKVGKYINEKLSSFVDEFRTLALESEHPFIAIYLQNALYEFKRDLHKGVRTIGSWEEIVF